MNNKENEKMLYYDKFTMAKETLEKYGQEHLLDFYEQITDKQKENLIDEILNLNFEEILELYENSKKDNKNYEVSPINQYHEKGK